MARIRTPHGCYYKVLNVINTWGNTIYLTNDLRIIGDVTDDYDAEDKNRSYQKASCCPLSCNVVKPKWHEEFNYQIYDEQNNYTD